MRVPVLPRALSLNISYQFSTVKINNVFKIDFSTFSLRFWNSSVETKAFVSLCGFCGKGVIVFSMCYNSELLGYLVMNDFIS